MGRCGGNALALFQCFPCYFAHMSKLAKAMEQVPPGALVVDARLEKVDLVPRAVAQRVAVRYAPAAALACAGRRVPRAIPAQGLARARIAGAGAIRILTSTLQAGCCLALQLMRIYKHTPANTTPRVPLNPSTSNSGTRSQGVSQRREGH